MATHPIANAVVEVLQGDLVLMDVDAIVNAANEGLLAGGGVCGAIFKAAGHQLLQAACDEVAPCPTGQARVTPGFNLPAKFVIHAVGPVWQGGTHREAEKLAGAYRSSLALAQAERLSSIAFPAISTGIFGYPLELATSVAVHTTADFLRSEPGSLQRVIFVVRDPYVQQIYEQVLSRV